MKNIYKCFGLLFILSGLVACEIDEQELNLPPEAAALPALQTGSLDFSKYVAVGASFTAGFTDNALFLAGQEYSFPNLLAQQFAKAGGGSFTQPLTNDNIGGLLYGGNQIAGPRLFFNGAGPATLDAVPTTEVTSKLSGPFNNMGVPGAKSFHILAPGYGSVPGVLAGTANPFFSRFSSSETASVLDDAMSQNPTFFTLSEIGGNDVLGYAITGGDGTNPITPSAGAVGVGFDATFATLVGALTSGGAKGAVTNVPYITDLAHFKAIAWNFLDPNDPRVGPALLPQIDVLNAQLYGPLDGIFTAYGEPDRMNLLSATEANPLLIHDENATDRSAEITGALTDALGAPTAAAFGAIFGKARQATENDLITLSASGVIATVAAGVPAPVNVNGISFPLPDTWVLLPEEQTAIRNATDAYNATIEAVTTANPNVVLVDLNSVLTEASMSGVGFDNYNMTTDLVFGGLISLDGIHLTSRGYGLMANKFLEALDAGFGSNFAASGSMAKADDLPIFFPASLQ